MKSYRILLLFAAFSIVALPANAAIVFFNLQGKAGAGMLAGNENGTISGNPGSGGEIGPGISFDDVSNILTLNVGWGTGNGFTNLTGNATAAHIHGPTATASFTENASVKYGLDALPGFNNSSTNGGWTSTTVAILPADVAGLLEGRFYLNVHTATNTGGEIRGNLVAVPEPGSFALLSVFATGFCLRRKPR